MPDFKSLSALGMEGCFFSQIKDIYKKPTDNLIHTGERPHAFPLRSGTTQGCLL